MGITTASTQASFRPHRTLGHTTQERLLLPGMLTQRSVAACWRMPPASYRAFCHAVLPSRAPALQASYGNTNWAKTWGACSMLADATSFWAYRALRHAALPTFPALSLSLWTGSLAVRSAAGWAAARRTVSCGEACILLVKAVSAALFLYPGYACFEGGDRDREGFKTLCARVTGVPHIERLAFCWSRLCRQPCSCTQGTQEIPASGAIVGEIGYPRAVLGNRTYVRTCRDALILLVKAVSAALFLYPGYACFEGGDRDREGFRTLCSRVTCVPHMQRPASCWSRLCRQPCSCTQGTQPASRPIDGESESPRAVSESHMCGEACILELAACCKYVRNW